MSIHLRLLTAWLPLSCAALTVAGHAAASDRAFAYTHESAVLNPGHAELEPWTTVRAGREQHYLRFDNRLEFEAGLTRQLQTAFYLNTTAISQDGVDELGATTRSESHTFEGVSSEWKYKLSDPVAHPLGSALYLEGTLGPHAAELELKLILDKHVGDLLLAANLVGEYEQDWEVRGELEHEVEFELDLAVGYRVTDAFVAGVELVQRNELEGGSELESATLSGGPTLGYSGGGWWSVVTFLPQLVGFVGVSDGDFRDLEHREKVELRALLGFHL